jgi:hypothetical protein
MANKFKIAHIKEQGVDLIIIPLDSSFDYKTQNDQIETVGALQMYASSAGLAGKVVPVWLSGRNMKFIAPPNWHPFFKSISWDFIHMNINRELTCG